MPYDWDAIVKEDAAEKSRAGALASRLSSPEAHARAVRAADAAGLPVDVAARNLLEVEGNAKARRYDWDAIVRDKPRAASLVADPDTAPVAQDDLGPLGRIEQAFEGIAAKFRRGAAQTRAGMALYERERGQTLNAEADAQLRQDIETMRAPEPERSWWEAPLQETAEMAGQMVATVPLAAKRGLQGAIAGGTAGSLAGGVGAIPGAILGGTAGAGAGFAEAMARSSSGQVAADLQEAGAPPGLARVGGAIAGLGEAGLEFAGMRLLSAPARRVAKSLIRREVVAQLQKQTLKGAAWKAALAQAEA
ncbi:MAG: hypothetical protein PHS14_14215, partial [Elusimicrobia bacterium]|nr:hypothetical protein [Elusimicrobiota bacterium]